MSKVLVFGVFDVFHLGHDFFLREAAKYGDELYVVVARDRNVLHVKGRTPQDNEQKRLEQVLAHPVVTNARLGYQEWEKRTQVLVDIAPDIICLGYDQNTPIPRHIRVARITSFHPEIYKSSLLRTP